MEHLSALIFDIDGTFADTERDGHRVAFNLAFEAAGLGWKWSPELYGELLSVTGGKERIRFYLDEYNTDYQKPDDFDNFVADLHASKTRFYTILLSEGKIPLRSGVERLIREAKDTGILRAIASTTTPENVTALLTYTLGAESIGWFEVIGAGDIVPAKKPSPDIYNFVMEKMHLKPESCIAFEDSYNGIQSSTQAGLPTIITTNGYTENDDFSSALVVLDKMGEPGDPFSIQKGDVQDHTYLDMELVRALHIAANENREDDLFQ